MPLWIYYENPLSLQMIGQPIFQPFQTLYQSKFTPATEICGRFSHLPPPLEKMEEVITDWLILTFALPDLSVILRVALRSAVGLAFAGIRDTPALKTSTRTAQGGTTLSLHTTMDREGARYPR